jgi:hypothetical protein
MNFHHLLPRHRQHWRNTEVATVLAMRAAGKINREIAAVIGRTRQSVAHKAKQLQIKPQMKRPLSAPAPEVIIILKDLLADYYALGWRVQSHGGFAVTIVWPHQSEPRMPG